jgi:tight adherence protein B
VRPAAVAFICALAMCGLGRAGVSARRRGSVLRRSPVGVADARPDGVRWKPRWPVGRFARVLSRRRSARYGGQLPTALDLIAGALRSGASLPAAVADAGRAVGPPLNGDLGDVVRGAPLIGFEPALRAWAARRTSEAVKLVVAALTMGADTGGGLASALDGLAASLRDREAAAAEARALSAQASMSAVVIGLAPVIFCGFTAATDRATAGFLFTSAIGWACLVGGLALDVVGWLWMSRITALDSLP